MISLKDRRLAVRFEGLVRRHLHAVTGSGAGSASLPSGVSSFAETQAAWRFYNNPRIELAELVEPLREFARQHLRTAGAELVLLVHDWCKLSFPNHTSKQDQAELKHNDWGYDISSVLAVSGSSGAPLAPVELHLKTSQGLLSTRRDSPPQDVHHVEQVLPTMEASRRWELADFVLHIIDREADSIGHFRAWDAAGHYFLVRGHEQRRLLWEGQSLHRREIGEQLQSRKKFRQQGTALYHGRPATLWVSEASVVCQQPARTMVQGKQVTIPGPPLKLRLIVAQVRDRHGKILATWYLLSNAPGDRLSAARLARCYYWRWRIESFFKLLKSHAQQIESWQQETGVAIARRMLVASMACATVWHLQQDDSPAANVLKDTLVRFSGRQTKRQQPHTAPALLAGLWPMLTMLAYLEHHDVSELKQLIKTARLPIDLHDS